MGLFGASLVFISSVDSTELRGFSSVSLRGSWVSALCLA
jgi:hypothetical protein